MMKNCINCGYSLELNAKFCPECGRKQPENNSENQASPLVGDKNVISTGGGDITGTKITGGNVSYTNVHHAQDDTKKRVRCFYTGQGVALEDLLNCPSCKKDVARSYYNFNNKRCYHCDDTAKNEYTLLMRDYLSDGRLDPTEIKQLQMHQVRLLLTDDETKIIESAERERLAFVKTSNISDKELKDIEDLAKLFELNKHIKQGDSIINVLYKKYPQSPEVSFYYFLNEFEKKDTKLYDLALSSREDNLFAYYFGGIAAELEGKTEEFQKIIEKLSLVYEEYFYLNDALKLLSLAEKFEYQPNKLISDKVIALINEIETSSIKGIYLSAYLGLIGYVDNYCCNAANAAAIAKNSDATSAALGFFFINIREHKLLAEKRKIEAQKQAEQERIEFEKQKKKKAEEKVAKQLKEKIIDKKKWNEEIIKSTSVVKIKKGGFFSRDYIEITSNNCVISNFKNGDPIKEARSEEEMKEALNYNLPAWCWYKFDESNSKLGKLYNKYAVLDKRGLAPEGYKIPNKLEWLEIINICGSDGANYLSKEFSIKSSTGIRFKGKDNYKLNMNVAAEVHYHYGISYFREGEAVTYHASDNDVSYCFYIYLNKPYSAKYYESIVKVQRVYDALSFVRFIKIK